MRFLLMTLWCVTASVAPVEIIEAKQISIPAGDLREALEALAKQSGAELVYQTREVQGVRTKGVNGDVSPVEAVRKLLEGTSLVVRTDRSGAMLIASAARSNQSPTLRVAAATSNQAPSEAPPGTPLHMAANEAAAGETAKDDSGIAEIIVSARKRQESILNVPVIETAIPKIQLERFQVTDMGDLATLVPGTNFTHSTPVEGMEVSIRGVGTISLDQGVDSSVSLNIDGLSLSSGLAFTSGLFDLQQIEVLKGPQALFYGKSSPGGVIALRTADPTDQVELIAREAYDFESVNPREELIVSGPVTDTLKLRLASMYSDSEGYFREEAVAAPGTGALTPTNLREPDTNEYIIRGTALWDPSSQFTARLKANIDNAHTVQPGAEQLASCPDGPGFAPSGIAFIGGDNCNLDRNVRVVNLNPINFPGILNNGVPFNQTVQNFGTLELNYRPDQNLSVTSTTGLYHLDEESAFNGTYSTAAGPAIGINVRFHRKDFTEEMRLNSEFTTPVNFTVGALYEDGLIDNRSTVIGNSAYDLPGTLADGEEYVDIKTYSVFGQLRWQIVSQLELAGGLRWTDETRTETPYNLVTGTPVFISVAVPRIHSDNVVPEVTLTYKPTDDMTLFAAYKQADKSGSFSLGGTPTAGANNSFGEERVVGSEIGMKSLLLDRRLALNLAAYNYHYDGLQVGAVGPPVDGQVITETLNAGAARTFGVDFDTAYRPVAVEGLGLNAALNWNRARYLSLNGVPCWGGQTIAAGCNQNLNSATGLYTAQNLAGTPMVRAPAWQANLGFDYEFPVGRNLTMVFANNNAISSKFVTFLAIDRPDNDNYQTSFFKSDLSLTLKPASNHWEIALVGKDINNKITAGNCSSANYANGALLGGEITGGTGRGPAGIDEVGCFTDPGRELWLRVTVRPSI